MKINELLPCPFCGFIPDSKEPDCCYPVGKLRDAAGNFILYGIHCYESHGGCSAQILGDSVDECISKWNTRA